MLILGSSCYCWFAYVCMIWWQRTFLQKLASGHNDFSNLRHFFSTHKRTGLAQAQPPSTHWPRSTGCRRQSGASTPLSFGYLAIWVAPCWNDQEICKNKPGNDQLPTKSNYISACWILSAACFCLFWCTVRIASYCRPMVSFFTVVLGTWGSQHSGETPW